MGKKEKEDDQVLMTEEVPVTEEVNDSIESEDRIDEFAVNIFKSMGYKKRLSENTVSIYKAFKMRRDRQQPGRLSPEGFAFVSILADMADGNTENGTLNLR